MKQKLNALNMNRLKLFAASALALILLSSATVEDNDDVKSPLKPGYTYIHHSGVMAFGYNNQIGFCIPSTDLYIYGFYDFSDIYSYDWSNRDYLIWVARGEGKDKKWAVFNGFEGKLETDFLYEYSGAINLPNKIGYDSIAYRAIYEVKARTSPGGELTTFQIKVIE